MCSVSEKALGITLKSSCIVRWPWCDALYQMLRIGSLGHPSLVEVRVDFEANVLHQIVDVVTMVLEQVDLISLVHGHSLADLSGLRFLNKSVLVSLNSRSYSIVLYCGVQALLSLSHLIGTLGNELCFLSKL